MLWAKQRKWGWYLTLLRLPWFCIKILKFNPGGELSVQSHQFRDELWIGIWNKKGTETSKMLRKYWVSNYRHKLAMLCEKPYFYIPHAWIHWAVNYDRLHPSYFLEIQWGSKVSEDDIERYAITRPDVNINATYSIDSLKKR